MSITAHFSSNVHNTGNRPAYFREMLISHLKLSALIYAEDDENLTLLYTNLLNERKIRQWQKI